MKRVNNQTEDKAIPTAERKQSFYNRSKKLDPEVKSWLDNVIIPALVWEYLAEIRSKSQTQAPLAFCGNIQAEPPIHLGNSPQSLNLTLSDQKQRQIHEWLRVLI